MQIKHPLLPAENPVGFQVAACIHHLSVKALVKAKAACESVNQS